MKSLDFIRMWRFRNNEVLTSKQLNRLVWAIRALERELKRKRK